MSDIGPVFERDAQLERRAQCAHQLGLIDSQKPIVGYKSGYGRLTDPYSSDRIGFHERDIAYLLKHFAHCRSRHPAGRAPTGNDDPLLFSGFSHDSQRSSRSRRKARTLAATSGVIGPSMP